MRKNGVNKELIAIDGGVCAPQGFQICAARCGFMRDGNETADLALLYAPKRYSTAYIGYDGGNVGACVALSKKHVDASMSSAILFNGGVANGYGADAADLAEKVSRLLANKLKIDRKEIVHISTGDLGGKADLATYQRGIDTLDLFTNEKRQETRILAEVFKNNPENNGLAFSFQLGDIVCTIGAYFHFNSLKGGVGTNCVVLTTDVSIAPKMLQKALKNVTNEYFNMLGDKLVSPNDCVCMLASGTANNWTIAENNSDYQKFVYALSSVADKICKKAVEIENGKGFLVKIIGAQSKNAAKRLALRTVSYGGIKNASDGKKLDAQRLLYALLGTEDTVSFEGIRITLQSRKGELVIFEEETLLPVNAEKEKEVLLGGDLEIIIRLSNGNYCASAYGFFA
ncbi:MAG: hypothetical protein E7355_00650 [Clostridiales bacterium]|nr:hypothetical protein [Clostridiales bacterium]